MLTLMTVYMSLIAVGRLLLWSTRNYGPPLRKWRAAYYMSAPLPPRLKKPRGIYLVLALSLVAMLCGFLLGGIVS
jgi:hypothetical protein